MTLSLLSDEIKKYFSLGISSFEWVMWWRNIKSLPTSVHFILCNTVLERVTSGGIFGAWYLRFRKFRISEIFDLILAILALFINQQLLFNESISTAIYHGNDFLLHSATILGAILADSYIGLYKSLLTMIVVFGIGCGLLAIGAINFSLTIMRTFSFIAFILICIGAGCCRCNYNVFGAVQFNSTEQLDEINFFYTLQFFLLKFGQVLGMLSFPLLRESSEYSVVFGVAMLLMALSFIILRKGKRFYTDPCPSGNMLVKFCKCITVRTTCLISIYNYKGFFIK